MNAPRFGMVVWAIVALTAAATIVLALSGMDRSDPLIYQDAWYEALPAEGQKSVERITSAAPGQEVILALKIQWPRTNCSTELERRFIGSDGALYKVPPRPGEPAQLGPPPASLLDSAGSLVSRRRVLLPAELPEGEATHSPNAWERCTAPARRWDDYLTELVPIFVGPKGADAKIMIKR